MSNFIKEEEKLSPPITAQHTINAVVLSIQNVSDGTSDVASALTILSRDKVSREEVIKKIGHARIAYRAADIRLTALLERLKNPESLKGSDP